MISIFLSKDILSSENLIDKLEVFPNPATNYITLKSPLLINSEIKIFNLLGEEIYCKSANSILENISTSNFPSAIYTVIVQSYNILMIQTFVKK